MIRFSRYLAVMIVLVLGSRSHAADKPAAVQDVFNWELSRLYDVGLENQWEAKLNKLDSNLSRKISKVLESRYPRPLGGAATPWSIFHLKVEAENANSISDSQRRQMLGYFRMRPVTESNADLKRPFNSEVDRLAGIFKTVPDRIKQWLKEKNKDSEFKEFSELKAHAEKKLTRPETAELVGLLQEAAYLESPEGLMNIWKQESKKDYASDEFVPKYRPVTSAPKVIKANPSHIGPSFSLGPNATDSLPEISLRSQPSWVLVPSGVTQRFPKGTGRYTVDYRPVPFVVPSLTADQVASANALKGSSQLSVGMKTGYEGSSSLSQCQLTMTERKPLGKGQCQYKAMTALHCVTNDQGNLFNQLSVEPWGNVVAQKVDYNSETGYDMAIITMAVACRSTDEVAVVPLRQAPQSGNPWVESGEAVLVDGRRMLIGNASDRVASASLLAVDLNDPVNFGVGIYPGDSGGGVFAKNADTGKLEMVGVISMRPKDDASLGFIESKEALNWANRMIGSGSDRAMASVARTH